MAPSKTYSKTAVFPAMRPETLLLPVLAVILALLCSACASSNSAPMTGSMVGGTVLTGESGPSLEYNGKTVSTIKANSVDQGIFIPGGNGQAVWIPGEQAQGLSAGYADARELKLKVRELAEQLISCVDSSMNGGVALPVSFVNMDNMDETSSFGRFVAEQMYYEFNQRGFPVKEYKARGNTIVQRGNEGEFYLSGQSKNVPVGKGGLVVAGTYYSDADSIFVNARIIRPSDGMVLRTGNLVLKNNGLTKRMLARSGKVAGRAAMAIKDLSVTTQAAPPVPLTPFDQGEDIH